MLLKERLAAAIKHSGLTQNEVGNAVRRLPDGNKFIQQTLSSLVTGRTKSSSYVVHIAIACGVNPTWLATGIGDMLSNGTVHQIAEATPIEAATFNNKTKDAVKYILNNHLSDVFSKMTLNEQVETVFDLYELFNDDAVEVNTIKKATVLKMLKIA